jgi:hypothetical protein
VNVNFHCSFCDGQGCANLFVLQTSGHESQNFDFPTRELNISFCGARAILVNGFSDQINLVRVR